MKLAVVIPAFNEEAQLGASVKILDEFLSRHFRIDYEIVIADNGSTDRTLEFARQLGYERRTIRVVHLNEKGRGRALKSAWLASRADLLSYMDVDLSTDLSAFPPLIEGLMSGGFDLATGSRLLKPELIKRGWKREFISRCYNVLVKVMFHTRFSDAQCGFKAITRPAAQALLPLVEDNGWFFDTELLVLAEKVGYRIFDLPVRWVDDSDSRVRIIRTAWDDIKGLIRMRKNCVGGRYGRATSAQKAAKQLPTGNSNEQCNST